jgi:hypothetical protein
MAPQALLCSQCRAPLETTTTSKCKFCGTLNQIQQPIGSTQIRAVVRKVLAEDARKAQPNQLHKSANPLGLYLGVGTAVIFGFAVAIAIALSHRTKAVSVVKPVLVPINAAIAHPPVEAPEPVEEPPQKPTGIGTPDAIAFGQDDDIFIVSGQSLVKANRKSMEQVWHVALPTGGFGRNGGGSIVALAGRVAYADSNGINFYEAASGEKKGQYLFKSNGFKVSACGTGNQVLAKTVFDGTLRFDIKTGTRVSGNTWCNPMDNIHCDSGQKCGWDSSEPSGLSCRYFLSRRGSKVTFCEEEGTKALVLVDRLAGKNIWKTIRGPKSSTNPEYVSVVDGVLVTSDSGQVEAFEDTTGTRIWSHPIHGNSGAILSDGHQLYFGFEGTVVVLNAKTGTEVGRFIQPVSP